MVSTSRKQLQMMVDLARTMRANVVLFIPDRVFGRLRRSIRFIVTSKRIVIYSYYYWARFVNDGRRAISDRNGRPMVFFRDPTGDPRIAADYPRKQNDVSSMTRAEFYAAVRSGQVVFAKHVDATEGLHFLEQGISLTRRQIPEHFRQLFKDATRRLVRRSRGKITVRM